jgi:hypothetical protein
LKTIRDFAGEDYSLAHSAQTSSKKRAKIVSKNAPSSPCGYTLKSATEFSLATPAIKLRLQLQPLYLSFCLRAPWHEQPMFHLEKQQAALRNKLVHTFVGDMLVMRCFPTCAHKLFENITQFNFTCVILRPSLREEHARHNEAVRLCLLEAARNTPAHAALILGNGPGTQGHSRDTGDFVVYYFKTVQTQCTKRRPIEDAMVKAKAGRGESRPILEDLKVDTTSVEIRCKSRTQRRWMRHF